MQSNPGSPVPLHFRHPSFSPEKLGYQTWHNGSCLYPATSFTACAKPLSKSKEAPPNIDNVVELNVIHMHIQLEDNLLARGESVPTSLLKLSQHSRTPSVWHTLFLREEYSPFPHAPLYSICGVFFCFLERLFQRSSAVNKEFKSKAQSWCKFAISINENCESSYILCYVLWIYGDLFIIMGSGPGRPLKMTLLTSSSS